MYLLILRAQRLPLPGYEAGRHRYLDSLEIMAAVAVYGEHREAAARLLDQALVLEGLELGFGEGRLAALFEQPLQLGAGAVGLGDLERGVRFDEFAVGSIVGLSVLVGKVVVVL